MASRDLAAWAAWISYTWRVEPSLIGRVRPGFSGADVYQVFTAAAGTFALRFWPAGEPDAARLTWIHACQARAARGCDFIPRLVPTAAGGTWIQREDRLCELSTWQPGAADFHQHPSTSRLAAAMSGLARLHAEWSGQTSMGPCPAALRRHARLRAWTPEVDASLNAALARWTDPRQADLAHRASRLLQAQRTDALKRLTPWCQRAVPLQVCLADIWHDHVLFTGNHLTGMVDLGSTRWDHVAVDLARLLGSLVGDDAEAWALGLSAYASAAAGSGVDASLPRLLHETGRLAAVANWLRMLVLERHHFAEPARAWARLEELVNELAAVALGSA